VEFVFNIRKSIAATGLLCRLNGGKIEVREMLKMLYLADKTAITKWHRSITGDLIFSMPQGMVLSRIYNLARYNVSGSDMEAWKSVFTPREGHAVSVREDANLDMGPLSEREEDALKSAFETVKGLISEHGEDYITVLHDMLPEWKNPNGSSILVDPSEILLKSGEDPDEITAISAELAAINSAMLALHL